VFLKIWFLKQILIFCTLRIQSPSHFYYCRCLHLSYSKLVSAEIPKAIPWNAFLLGTFCRRTTYHREGLTPTSHPWGDMASNPPVTCCGVAAGYISPSAFWSICSSAKIQLWPPLHKPERHRLFLYKEPFHSFTSVHRLFKLAQLTSDLDLARKLTCSCYLLSFQLLCSLQSSTAITSYDLLVHWLFFFSCYHFGGLYQFSTSVIFKFYVFIALLIILERGGEKRERRKNRIHVHLLLICNGYRNVPIVHHQMLSFTTVTSKAMCYWSVVSERFKAQICFLLPLTLHDSVHSEIIANTDIQWVEKDAPERYASDFSGLLRYKCMFRSSVDGC